MQRLLLIFFGIAILGATFFISTMIPGKPQVPAAKSRDAKTLVNAIEDYRTLRGIYPIFVNVDVPLSDVERSLVIAGIVEALPVNEWIKQSRYVSPDGQSYGLLIAKTPQCLVEVNTSRNIWWGPPVTCTEF